MQQRRAVKVPVVWAHIGSYASTYESGLFCQELAQPLHITGVQPGEHLVEPRVISGHPHILPASSLKDTSAPARNAADQGAQRG